MSTSQLDAFVFSRKRAPLYSFSCASYALKGVLCCSFRVLQACVTLSHSFSHIQNFFSAHTTTRHVTEFRLSSHDLLCHFTQHFRDALSTLVLPPVHHPRPGSPGSFASCASSPRPLVRSHLSGKVGFLTCCVAVLGVLPPAQRQERQPLLSVACTCKRVRAHCAPSAIALQCGGNDILFLPIAHIAVMARHPPSTSNE